MTVPKEVLYAWRRDRLELREALDAAAAAVAGGVAMVSTPELFAMAVVGPGGTLLGPTGVAVAGIAAFEVRCFTRSNEFRWVQLHPDGRGSAVVLSEDDSAAARFGGHPCHLEFFARITGNQYLLWGGQPTQLVGAWSTLHSPRAGALAVPVALVGQHSRVALESVEYVARDGHGNAYVAEERLLGLREVR
ncbi:MAG: hypothetical protein QOE93_2377 [Actinomycetota bacterium]|jgi:CRISPR-associated protein (TIGR03984 family)|nr:hypothetical protein [Actinomycetota bacterium]